MLDEPAELKPNAKVKVIAPDAEEDVTRDFARLSEPAFQKIWGQPARCRLRQTLIAARSF